LRLIDFLPSAPPHKAKNKKNSSCSDTNLVIHNSTKQFWRNEAHAHCSLMGLTRQRSFTRGADSQGRKADSSTTAAPLLPPLCRRYIQKFRLKA